MPIKTWMGRTAFGWLNRYKTLGWAIETMCALGYDTTDLEDARRECYGHYRRLSKTNEGPVD